LMIMSTTVHVAPSPKSPVRNLLTHVEDFFVYAMLCRGNRINFLRRKGVRIGQGCQILNSVDDYGSEPWLIEIGSRVTVTRGVLFLTHDGSSRLFRDQIPGGSRWGNRFGRILIHDESFIGANSILMPGVEIGPCSIVGAGSLVNKNVPPGMVCAGTPAKAICTLEEYIENYQQKMVPLKATTRAELRKELTLYFWGEER
jgi:acetyltransferase-like isoleucine patch superfamily enzyme